MLQDGVLKTKETVEMEFGCQIGFITWLDMSNVIKTTMENTSIIPDKLDEVVKQDSWATLEKLIRKSKGTGILRKTLNKNKNVEQINKTRSKWEAALGKTYSLKYWENTFSRPWHLKVSLREKAFQIRLNNRILGHNRWTAKFVQGSSRFCFKCLENQEVEVEEDLIHLAVGCVNVRSFIDTVMCWQEVQERIQGENYSNAKIILFWPFTDKIVEAEINLLMLWIKIFCYASRGSIGDFSVRNFKAYFSNRIGLYNGLAREKKKWPPAWEDLEARLNI